MMKGQTAPNASSVFVIRHCFVIRQSSFVISDKVGDKVADKVPGG